MKKLTFHHFWAVALIILLSVFVGSNAMAKSETPQSPIEYNGYQILVTASGLSTGFVNAVYDATNNPFPRLEALEINYDGHHRNDQLNTQHAVPVHQPENIVNQMLKNSHGIQADIIEAANVRENTMNAYFAAAININGETYILIAEAYPRIDLAATPNTSTNTCAGCHEQMSSTMTVNGQQVIIQI